MQVSNYGMCLQENIMQDRIYKLMWSQLASTLACPGIPSLLSSLSQVHFTFESKVFNTILFTVGSKSFAVGGEGKSCGKGQLVSTKGASFWKKIWKPGPLRMYVQHSGAKIRVFEQNTDIKFWLFYSGGEFMWNTHQILPATGSHWKPCTQFENSRRYWVQGDVNQKRCRRHKKSCTLMDD